MFILCPFDSFVVYFTKVDNVSLRSSRLSDRELYEQILNLLFSEKSRCDVIAYGASSSAKEDAFVYLVNADHLFKAFSMSIWDRFFFLFDYPYFTIFLFFRNYPSVFRNSPSVFRNYPSVLETILLFTETIFLFWNLISVFMLFCLLTVSTVFLTVFSNSFSILSIRERPSVE